MLWRILPRSVNIASNTVVGAKFEDTKWVIRSCKSNDRQYNGQEKKDKKTTIYKALHRKLKIEVNRGPPKGLAGPAPLLAPVVLLLTTSLPILFQYCYEYLWAVMKAGGLAL